jgi:hypothetical protein
MFVLVKPVQSGLMFVAKDTGPNLKGAPFWSIYKCLTRVARDKLGNTKGGKVSMYC